MTVNDRIRELLDALDRHAPGEAGHAQRVAVLATSIGERLGLDDVALLALRIAAQLHDIGKLRCPAQTLTKKEPLTAEEMRIVRRHPIDGPAIVSVQEEFQASVPGIAWHHERLDGSGYPDALHADRIPLQARIVAVAEVYDTVAWRPPYVQEPARSHRNPMEEVRATPGLDSRVLDALAGCVPLITPLSADLCDGEGGVV